MMGRAGFALGLALVAGCASVEPSDSFAEVQALAGTRLSQTLHWRTGGAEDQAVARQVDQLLDLPLDAAAAVQVALLENPELQATFEGLGIAQAQLVQAGLLRNPVFFAGTRFPGQAPRGPNVEFGVALDFLGVLTRSLRVELAEAEVARVELEVADAVLALAARTGVAYYEALGAKQVAQMRALTAEAAATSAELARQMHAAGNFSDRRLAIELGLYEDTRVAWAKAELRSLATREELTRTMGLWGHQLRWNLPDQLPELPAEPLDLAELETRAMGQRLDLAAAIAAANLAAGSLGASRDWRYLGQLDVGVSTERDPGGGTVTGPNMSLELPLFDRQQAQLAGQTARLRQADRRVEALAIGIRSEVRALGGRLHATRQLLEHFRDVVVPLREQLVQLTQEEFNYMLVGAFELILAKQEEYDAYQGYLEALTAYWTTRVELERALGGPLAGGEVSPVPAAPMDMTAPSTQPTHQHGD